MNVFMMTTYNKKPEMGHRKRFFVDLLAQKWHYLGKERSALYKAKKNSIIENYVLHISPSVRLFIKLTYRWAVWPNGRTDRVTRGKYIVTKNLNNLELEGQDWFGCWPNEGCRWMPGQQTVLSTPLSPYNLE